MRRSNLINNTNVISSEHIEHSYLIRNINEIATVVSLTRNDKIKRRKNKMLKIRLKRLGAKKQPTYRIIVINSTTKREGRPVQELGHYNPKTKVMKLDKASALEWVKKGAQPTETVAYLIKNCNDDGTLNYTKKEVVKLSKKAQAKAQAEAEVKAAAEAEAKAAAEAEAAAPAEKAPATEA